MEPIKDVPTGRLLLDSENPRLPEELQGESQDAILTYLEENEVLDELAASFVANGYFPTEPLVVLPPGGDGFRVVIEGNRRVATLMILLASPLATSLGLSFDLEPAPRRQQLAELSSIPAVEVASRSEVAAFLGYRHLNSFKPWKAESKSRYVWREVEQQAREHPDRDPFYEVARRVGSNSRGIRNSFLAFELLRQARDEHGLNIRPLLRERFGVWQRLLTAGGVLEYIGYADSPRTFAEVQAAAARLDQDRLAEIIEDLTPRKAGMRAVLQDSRSVTS